MHQGLVANASFICCPHPQPTPSPAPPPRAPFHATHHHRRQAQPPLEHAAVASSVVGVESDQEPLVLQHELQGIAGEPPWCRACGEGGGHVAGQRWCRGGRNGGPGAPLCVCGVGVRARVVATSVYGKGKVAAWTRQGAGGAPCWGQAERPLALAACLTLPYNTWKTGVLEPCWYVEALNHGLWCKGRADQAACAVLVTKRAGR